MFSKVVAQVFFCFVFKLSVGKVLNYFFKYLFIYWAVTGLSCGMRDLLVAACKLLVLACGIEFPD